ncbi:MAG: type III pantothenate kinase [Paludibacteraceae bacterium]|jgi:type III pantothenate kinase|nr:type III pantothenate kinase [Paludibacteraceae bacterium]
MVNVLNLCIDQGNSRTKVALCMNGRITHHFIYKSFASSDVERLFDLYPVTDSIISSVVNIEPAVVNTLHRLSRRFVLFDHQTPVPITNAYDTPETLGQDRLAAAVGAKFLSPDENLLIIDAGSAITYDFVSADGIYKGGNIAPGIKMRFTMLKQMTKKLPMVEADENDLLPLFGSNTRDAIAAGVIRGVAYEAKGYMRTLSKRVEHFRTYLTGGNAPYILRNVREPQLEIPAIRYEKHLVLIGLNCILEHNK